MLRTLLSYRLSLTMVMGTLAACLLPANKFPEVSVAFVDKYTHVLLFLGVSISLWMESELAIMRAAQQRWWCIGAPLLLGGIIEVLQATMTTTRSGDWLDFLADAIGVAVAALLFHFILRVRISSFSQR